MRPISVGTYLRFLVAAAVTGAASAASAVPMHQDLAGSWKFRLDPADKGVSQGWPNQVLQQTIRLPGSLQEQGFGDEVTVDTPWTGQIVDRSWFTEPKYAKYRQPGNIKIPFWLQPDKHYVGAAWYQREIDIPPEWKNRPIELFLERVHWETRAWLDGQELGRRDSLSAPHVYRLPSTTTPGKHRLTLRVDNRMIVDVGLNAHSVSDHTQSNWNGIVGRMELHAKAPVWLDDVQVFPDVARRAATLKLQLGNATGQPGRGRVTIRAAASLGTRNHLVPPQSFDIAWGADGGQATVRCVFGNEALLWDEFQPAVYELRVTLAGSQGQADEQVVQCGLRDFRVEGTQFAINGRRVFLRGTLECCVFPQTGYPPTDVAAWSRLLSICRSYGLNHVRFHSWCPPEAAFTAADQQGMYLQVECAAWARIGEGKPIDAWLYEEGKRIVRSYGNHPSFVMMAYGNEPSGKHVDYLTRWVEHWKKADARRVYTGAAGWPVLPVNQYQNIPAPRIQGWGQGLKSRINALPPETRTDYRQHVEKSPTPIVSHEIGQWCVYPNLDEVSKYRGVLKAKNFEIFAETLAANHMGDQARQFLQASGKLQILCYKEEIESALRTPAFGGMQLLQADDFPGQGTALVGWLDPFWDSKGYVTADEFRRFCNSTVVLARMDRRVWKAGEPLRADLEVAHFGPRDLRNGSITWRLVDDRGTRVAGATIPGPTLPTGKLTHAASIDTGPLRCPAPAKYRLEAGIAGTDFQNDWDVWVFPAEVDLAVPAGVRIAERLDAAAIEHLGRGGTVLLLPPPATIPSKVAVGFSSIFWNTAWTRGQAPHTLGILCDPRHAALAQFPTESHSNWQWWELVHTAAALVLDGLPADARPVVQLIDTWFENRRLGLLLEARVGGGRLLLSGMDLSSDLDHRPVARQMRHTLLKYVASSAFQPKAKLSVEQVRRLVEK